MTWKLRSRARLFMRGYARLSPYLSIDGWLTVDEAISLYELARSVAHPDAVAVEIGSWQGKSSVVLAKGLKGSPDTTLYCVDPFDAAGDPSSEADYREREGRLDLLLKERFEQNLELNGVGHVVRVLQGYSHDVVKGFDRPIDLLFIDGNHDYSEALRDVQQWTPMVVDGGIVCIHDVGNPLIPGPQRVVDEQFRGNPRWGEQRQVDSLFIARKLPTAPGSGRP